MVMSQFDPGHVPSLTCRSRLYLNIKLIVTSIPSIISFFNIVIGHMDRYLKHHENPTNNNERKVLIFSNYILIFLFVKFCIPYLMFVLFEPEFPAFSADETNN